VEATATFRRLRAAAPDTAISRHDRRRGNRIEACLDGCRGDVVATKEPAVDLPTLL